MFTEIDSLNHPRLALPSQSQDSATFDFTLELMRMLGMEVRTEGEHFYAEIPEEISSPYGQGVQFDAGENESAEVHAATFDSPLFDWLIKEVRERRAANLFPGCQPSGLYELSDKLFQPYRVDGGKIQLAGCTLEDRPILRSTYLQETSEGKQLRHVYVHADGTTVKADLICQLQIEDSHQLQRSKRSIKDSQRKIMEHAAQRQFGSDQRPLLQTVIWCKYAEPKLQFVIDDATAELSFGDWAHLFVTGDARPPAFSCERSGRSSYHLASCDEGVISVAEAIGTCEETKARVFEDELSVCTVTGKRILKTSLSICPVTDALLIPTAMQTCDTCRQKVAPASLQSGSCAACQTVAPVSKSDPRMALILDEYKQLDRYRKWQLSETAEVYILVATTLLERVLLVVEKSSLNVARVASAARWQRHWNEMQAMKRDELLRR